MHTRRTHPWEILVHLQAFICLRIQEVPGRLPEPAEVLLRHSLLDRHVGGGRITQEFALDVEPFWANPMATPDSMHTLYKGRLFLTAVYAQGGIIDCVSARW